MKRIIGIMFAISLALTMQAQNNVFSDSKEWLFKEGRRLYADKEYATALTLINRLPRNEFSPTERQELDYMRAISTFETNSLEGRALMLQYLDDYPQSGKREILAIHIAESYYFEHNFAQAKKWFTGANFDRLSATERNRATLYYALTLQELNEGEVAKSLLNSLRFTSKEYSSDAIFHLAVIDYDNNDLQPAYNGFKSIEFDDKYHLEIPYYLAAIYLKNGEYVRAEKVADAFLKDNSNTRQGVVMQQILGASYFGQKRYSEAIEPLKLYISKNTAPQRIAYYQLALSYFETGHYQDAIPLFDKCTGHNDAIAQNAYLHIGIIQLKLNDITKARLAFEQAASMNGDSRIREEALYNYALCIHQTRYSPFAESVKVFEQFLNEYPKSKHTAQVNSYLVEVYMNTRNYDVALQSIEKIERPSKAILEAKQKVLYRLGVQSFIDNDMPQAIEYMNRSLELSKYNKETHSDALYWRGEANYRLNKYNAADRDYQATLSLSPRNASNAMYGLAYTYFQRSRYNDAINSFNRFLQNSDARNAKSMRADAYNRLGDCNFYNRNYVVAEQYYRKATETDKNHSDYALYRSGIAQGLTKNYEGKIETLQKLINEHPKSVYAEQAYYELGRSYVSLENYERAVEVFTQFTKRYPKSKISRRAVAEIAMIHNQNGEHEKAIVAYKQIIRDYPQSEEAQIAAQDLKNIYVENGKVDEYATYAASTPGLKAMESSERDTLTYLAAEKIYGKGNMSEAKKEFEKYLRNFPEGSFAINSHYYCGLIYYNQQAPKDALAHLEKVIAFPDNKYSEEAIALASELYYKEGAYDKAYELFKQLSEKSDNEERRKACLMNMTRCAYMLGDSDNAVAVAGEILKNGNISPEWEREALYIRAKSLIQKEMSDVASSDLKKLADDTRSKQGAEAKYLLAQYYYDSKQYDNCEKEILSYIEASTPHSYWLARSFVLLADLYITQERSMEAKQYLLSLQNNYTGDDDIAELIKQRLESIAKLESSN